MMVWLAEGIGDLKPDGPLAEAMVFGIGWADDGMTG